MVADIIYKFFYPIFRQCAYWANVLLEAVDGWYVILGAILLCCIISLFLVPLRGQAVGAISSFTVSKTNGHSKGSKNTKTVDSKSKA